MGANTHPQITELDPLPGTSNYFIGNDPARWQRDVPNYARVKYTAVYSGIDLVYYGNQRQLEYDLVVAPGADTGRIALAFDGVDELSIDAEGNLVLQTAHGDLAQQKPVIYQDIGGKRQIVDGRYELHADDLVGFQVGATTPRSRWSSIRSCRTPPISAATATTLATPSPWTAPAMRMWRA